MALDWQAFARNAADRDLCVGAWGCSCHGLTPCERPKSRDGVLIRAINQGCLSPSFPGRRFDARKDSRRQACITGEPLTATDAATMNCAVAP